MKRPCRPHFWRIGNPDITWETTTNINVGVEFSLWKGRLAGNVDFYTKRPVTCCFGYLFLNQQVHAVTMVIWGIFAIWV
ncbi:TonB-dependent receptor [Bacteroides cellulosilyticus]|uniref:TonB-dependent receptor n=1 Tax=Bacteroides cellulosilyticus TaxID=246787 RepID=UPI0021656F91|nr:TonB-dependent receptor [Bacteroides cellulosilyticus]MCS3057424.1 TonB-dependent receptor [Bacteroides cellulosilyticus]